MLLRFFNSKQVFVLVLIPVLVTLLWLHSFLSITSVPNSYDASNMPLYNFFDKIFYTTGLAFLPLLVGVFLIVLQAFFILRLDSRYKITETRSYLPAVIFVLISGSFLQLHVLHPILFANLFLMLAFERLLASVHKEHYFSYFFDAAFLVAVASLFYIHVIYFIFVVWVALFTLHPLKWRPWIISILALLTPFALLAGYFYLKEGSLLGLGFTIFFNMLFGSEQHMSLLYYLFLGFLALLAFFSVYGFLNNFLSKSILSRKYFAMFLAQLILPVLLYFLVSAASIEMLVIFAFPAAYLFSSFLSTIRIYWIGELAFAILFLLIGAIQFM